jgi:hypothetical protein
MVIVFLLQILGGVYLEQPPTKVESPFAAEFLKIKGESERLEARMVEDWQAAKTEGEKEAARVRNFERIHQDGTALAKRALSLVQHRPTDSGAVDVLIWIVRAHGMTKPAQEAADLLVRHHAKDPKTLEVAKIFNLDAGHHWPEKVLRALVSTDLPRDQKAEALYRLAECLKMQSEIPAALDVMSGPRVRVLEMRVGKEHLARFRMEQAAREQEAVRLFTELDNTFGQHKYRDTSYGELAKSAIFEINNLRVGKPAPEIEGEDLDGKLFKLSEYRGKVVLLDFWGHW